MIRSAFIAGVLAVVLAGAHAGLAEQVRFATFNASLNRSNAGDLIADLSDPNNVQAQAVAEIIQRINPDVLLINEFDWDTDSAALPLFQQNYLGVSQNGVEPVTYPYVFVAPSNTGLASGLDLNNDGNVGGPDDAFGFGYFHGQYAMAILSKYPIASGQARTFQTFLWKDMPNAWLPDDPCTPEKSDWYSAEELAAFRLSSKSHWDVPVQIGDQVVHVLASHPTPPVYDGAEDRNGTRNHDEVRFWADYITTGQGDYIYDDAGAHGGLPEGVSFVIVGDLNADPFDGDSSGNPMAMLLDSPLVNTTMTPCSLGGLDATMRQGQNNLSHVANPAHDTADWSEAQFGGPGNARADYVLPSADLPMVDAQIFWPAEGDELYYLTGPGYPAVSSDHRLVYVDLSVE